MKNGPMYLILKYPCKIIKHLGGKGYFKWVPDELYLKICFIAAFGKGLDLKNPKGFNEKLQWLKLYDHKEVYTTMVDKYAAKEYVKKIIGEDYIIPTLGVWNNFDDIDFDSLPNQFVLKCTHDSGGLVICRDKGHFNKREAKKKIEKSFKREFFYVGREWAYKNVKPRIIAEQFMEDATSSDLKDYKLMCFSGKVKSTFVCSNRNTKEGVHVTFFDTDWNQLPFERHYPRSKDLIERPVSYEEMVSLAEKLAEMCPFVRVDFYEVKGKPYFGELTLYPGDGFEEFSPEKYDEIIGSWVKLPGGGYLIDQPTVRLFIHLNQKRIVINQDGLTDYKFYCFNGEPQFLYVSNNISDHTNSDLVFYDMEMKRMPFKRLDYPQAEGDLCPPDSFTNMIHCVKKLAEGIPFVRVDFYEISGKLYFSELTFYPCNGFMKFDPDEYDNKMGDILNLP